MLLSALLKYFARMPGGWEASKNLGKPVSHQHILKKQNVLWCSKEDTIELQAFEVRSSQAANQSPIAVLAQEKILLWVVAHLPSIASVKNWKARTDFRIIKYVLHRPPSFPENYLKRPFPACVVIMLIWRFVAFGA